MRILAILFLLVSCSEPEIPSHLLVDNGGIFYENGQKKPFNGTSIENKNGKLFKKNYYQEGVVLKTEEFYGSGKINRIYLNQDNGYVVKVLSESGEDISNLENEFYYPNGSIYEKGRYSGGKKDGTWEYYNNDLGIQKREYWHEGLLLEIKDIKDTSIEDNLIVYFDEDFPKKKNFTGVIRIITEKTESDPGFYELVKILNGKPADFRAKYLSDSGKLIGKNTCSYSENGTLMEENLFFTEGRLLHQQCSYETRYYDKLEQYSSKGELVKINENTWEWTYKTFYKNGNILQETLTPSTGSIDSETSFKERTIDNMYYQNGKLHTTYELINGKKTYNRFNKDGLDISNGEGKGEDIDVYFILYGIGDDNPEAGFYKNGLKDGEWVERNGVDSFTYKEGIKNGPYKTYLIESYIEDNCLYESGQYKDGERHGEWITYVTFPKEDCGTIRKKTLYEMGNIIE